MKGDLTRMPRDFIRRGFPVAAGLILLLAACGGGGHKKTVQSSACGGVPEPGTAIAQASVAAGDNHSLALRRDGVVCAWGGNSFGQLGDGTTGDRSAPVKVRKITAVLGIASGHTHSLAVDTHGDVWAWGANSDGELGDGTFADQSVPVQVTGLASAVAVAAGDAFSMALAADGTVWTWGTNSNGQLGNSAAAGQSNVPVPVDGLTGITAIAAGGLHGLALDGEGKVWAWGFNATGQLGNSLSSLSQVNPTAVIGLTGVVAIAAGNTHSMALKSDGTVWTWGDNTHGQLGNGLSGAGSRELLPVQALNLTQIEAIAGGFSHSLALKSDGTFFSWGWNFSGQLGVGNFVESSEVPLQLSAVTGGAALAGGGSHSLALEQDGSVWAWGDNQSGQLGDGTGVGSDPLPVRVIDLIL